MSSLSSTNSRSTNSPSFDSKNFVFKKHDEDEENGAGHNEPAKEKPKGIKGYIEQIRDTRDFTHNYDPNDFSAHKKHCILAALGVTFWAPYAFCKNCQSARFYANQGLLTFIIEVLCSIVYGLLMNLVSIAFVENTFDGYRLSIAGWIVMLIFTVLCYAIPVFIVVTSVKNIRAGKVKEIPFIGKFRILG